MVEVIFSNFDSNGAVLPQEWTRSMLFKFSNIPLSLKTKTKIEKIYEWRMANTLAFGYNYKIAK